MSSSTGVDRGGQELPAGRAHKRPPISGRILLVEDDHALGLGMQDLLSRAGHEVELVRNGSDALEALRSRTFDIMILDLGLPEISGLEVVLNP